MSIHRSAYKALSAFEEELSLNADDLEELAAFLDEAGVDMEVFRDLHRKADGNNIAKALVLKHDPVDIMTFVKDDYFLGLEALWPVVEDAIQELGEGGYVEAILTGAIGIAKTTIAQIVTGYNLYQLSCYESPQIAYGLLPSSSIVFAMMNRTDSLAKKVTYGEFRSMLDGVPYFKEKFPFQRHVASAMLFPNKIRVEPGTADANKWLGINVIGGIIDEVNFMAMIEDSKKLRNEVKGAVFDQAEKVYRSLVRRRKSRFLRKGRLPGCLCVVSSKGYPGDFTERRIAELQDEENRHLTFIYDKAAWEVLPEDRYEGPKFRVFVGNERKASKILKDDEEAPIMEDTAIIEVPIEYRDDFKTDMEGSLRDIGGRSTITKAPYFANREAVFAMSDLFKKLGGTNAFGTEEWCFEDGEMPYNSSFKLLNPGALRAAHIDLGVTSDSAGIAVGHVARTVLEQHHDKATNVTTTSELPLVFLDAVATINPPMNGEIDFEEIREILYYLKSELGIPIDVVTFDGFESVDMRQILKKRGFKTGYLSVEKIEFYRNLKQGIYGGRVACPFHQLAFGEIIKLEKTPDGKKVDHPPQGSKDTSDGICGVYNSLLRRRSAWHGVAEGKIVTSIAALGRMDEQTRKAVEATTGRRSLVRRSSGR